jgi:cysteine desulfurase
MGFGCTYVGVGHDGMVFVEEVRKAIRKETFLITLMHANNETGVLQPIEEIGTLAREKGISFHTDAAQTVGKIPVNAEKLNVDLLTIATHKFYGPKGVGALYIKRGVELSPLLFGAGHERGLKPGTENVPGIVGLGKACEMAHAYMKERTSHTKKMTGILYTGIKEKIPSLKLNGHETLRLPNTLNICIPGIDSTALLEGIKESVAASSGSACHAGERKPSAVLMAMGVSEADAMSSIRLSSGKDTTEAEIREAVEIVVKAVQAMARP